MRGSLPMRFGTVLRSCRLLCKNSAISPLTIAVFSCLLLVTAALWQSLQCAPLVNVNSAALQIKVVRFCGCCNFPSLSFAFSCREIFYCSTIQHLLEAFSTPTKSSLPSTKPHLPPIGLIRSAQHYSYCVGNRRSLGGRTLCVLRGQRPTRPQLTAFWQEPLKGRTFGTR